MSKSKLLQLAALTSAFMANSQGAAAASKHVDRAAPSMREAFGFQTKHKTGHRDARPRSQQKKRIHARQQGHAKRRGVRL